MDETDANIEIYNEGKISDPDIKVILLGDSACGKSKLMERYLESNYIKKRMSTHCLSLYQKTVSLSDGKICCDFWDTAGQSIFDSMHSSYYYNADVCILVFDVTRKQTYINLEKWYEELRSQASEIPCLLVANKIDCDIRVTRKSFKFAERHNLPFFFVSAADGTNVVKVFEEAILAGLGHKKFAAKCFVEECLDLFESSTKSDISCDG